MKTAITLLNRILFRHVWPENLLKVIFHARVRLQDQMYREEKAWTERREWVTGSAFICNQVPDNCEVQYATTG
jgi:hypothetical protein